MKKQKCYLSLLGSSKTSTAPASGTGWFPSLYKTKQHKLDAEARAEVTQNCEFWQTASSLWVTEAWNSLVLPKIESLTLPSICLFIAHCLNLSRDVFLVTVFDFSASYYRKAQSRLGNSMRGSAGPAAAALFCSAAYRVEHSALRLSPSTCLDFSQFFLNIFHLFYCKIQFSKTLSIPKWWF